MICWLTGDTRKICVLIIKPSTSPTRLGRLQLITYNVFDVGRRIVRR